MNTRTKEITVPKENAVFWMDKNGTWHNEHGKFEHPKIIRYFHRSIHKDENGYHLRQERDGMVEKVYFPHEDTALFVFDVRTQDGLTLMLNTGTSMELDPDQLFIHNDNLYLQTPEHCIKFAQNALVKFSRFIKEDQEDQGRLVLDFGGRRSCIPEK